MSWMNRMATALNAFWLTYNGATSQDTQLIPLEELGWTTAHQRQRRYALYEAYNSNIVYTDLYRAARQRNASKHLYRYIRSIYNPTARQNDLLRAYVYGGAVDMQDFSAGCVPIISDNIDRLKEPLKQVFTWSRLPELLPLFVGRGAKLGDSPMKLVDDPARGKCWIELLDPRKVRDVQFDAVGNVKAIIIEYERDEEADLATAAVGRVHPLEQSARSYLYTERIYKDESGGVRFEFYKDGEPFDYVNDTAGGELAAYDSDYPFVPVVWGGHQATTLGFCENAFGLATPKIDEINDAASLLNDQIRKSVNPFWAYIGATAANISFETEKRDQAPYVTLPAGADVKPMVMPLDISGALENLREMLSELERDMPELALQRVRDKGGNISGVAVENMYSDAVGRIQMARASYNASLVRGLQMAITVGGIRGYDGFRGFNELSYDRGEMDMYIAERPVFPDELTKTERITALGSVGKSDPPLQRLMLQAMGYSEEEVASVVDNAEERQERAIRAAARGFGNSLGWNDEDEPDEDTDNQDALEEETA